MVKEGLFTFPNLFCFYKVTLKVRAQLSQAKIYVLKILHADVHLWIHNFRSIRPLSPLHTATHPSLKVRTRYVMRSKTKLLCLFIFNFASFLHFFLFSFTDMATHFLYLFWKNCIYNEKFDDYVASEGINVQIKVNNTKGRAFFFKDQLRRISEEGLSNINKAVLWNDQTKKSSFEKCRW